MPAKKIENQSIFGEDIWTKVCGLFWAILRCLSGAAVRASDFRSSSSGFDLQPGRNQGTYDNSAFHPSGVGKLSTNLTGWG